MGKTENKYMYNVMTRSNQYYKLQAGQWLEGWSAVPSEQKLRGSEGVRKWCGCEIWGGWFQAGRTAGAKALVWEQGGVLQEEQRDWEEGAKWRKKVVGSDGREEEEPNPVWLQRPP